MDTLNSLLTAAAGYFGTQQQNDANLQLAKLQLGQPATPAPAPAAAAPAAATTAAQWIPGVSNTVVLAGGGLLLAFGLLVALRK